MHNAAAGMRAEILAGREIPHATVIAFSRWEGGGRGSRRRRQGRWCQIDLSAEISFAFSTLFCSVPCANRRLYACTDMLCELHHKVTRSTGRFIVYAANGVSMYIDPVLQIPRRFSIIRDNTIDDAYYPNFELSHVLAGKRKKKIKNRRRSFNNSLIMGFRYFFQNYNSWLLDSQLLCIKKLLIWNNLS